MTVETRSTIGLDDLIAVEYQCTQCKAKFIRLLDDKHKVPVACGNCNHPWMAEGSTEHKDLTDLQSLLRTFRRGSVNQQVCIRLEIGDVKESKTSVSDRASRAKD